MAKKKPNPYPTSDRQARAASFRWLARFSSGKHWGGVCVCAMCQAHRRGYLAGWRAYRLAARKESK